MFIGKPVSALARSAFAAALSATLVFGLVPASAFATPSENVRGGGRGL